MTYSTVRSWPSLCENWIFIKKLLSVWRDFKETRAIGLRPDRFDQIQRAEDAYRPFDVVCQHVQRHLGTDFR
jgi:hypothetical protein